ncbi:threonine/homoserine/homoserine lactone efflux protein [Hydrogenispora ethanolica]|jgi:threonine/homoserine/homoserine lactone efflux protein|uniref:Threonine/homoserine/homoserine lactone efflux protein n=1 Tax=Hydrogenispora ethanolica TaxID=1082276 RepID=A0A4V2QFE4_HYDET|nr:LysE family translocator [Hydrogenispora ethanolica]TCL71587.1 threonine/homoserine/homoserine lactone efflux protein [Hydrogenispora ethanolica]
MFGIVNYGLFVLSGVLLNITPGSDTLYILGRSISQGKKAGIMSVLGIGTGALVHTLLVAVGLSALLARSVLAFNLIKYLGAAYIMYLGVRAWFAKGDGLALKTLEPDSPLKIYGQGVLNNVLNPKVALFFLAFLPQFVTKDNPFGPLPFILLGLTFVTTGTLWCLLLAVFSSLATAKLRGNHQFATLLNKLTGVLFVGLGLNLLRAKAAN